MKLLRVVPVLLLVLVMSCSTIITEVDYDYDRTADFASLKTYDWLPGQTTTPEYALALKRFQNEVDAQLQAKGYKKTSDDPDFHVGIQGSSQTKYSQFQSRHAYYSEPFTYQEGTITLDIFDGKTGNAIYHAQAVGEGDGTDTPEEREKTAQRAVSKMLANSPPTR